MLHSGNVISKRPFFRDEVRNFIFFSPFSIDIALLLHRFYLKIYTCMHYVHPERRNSCCKILFQTKSNAESIMMVTFPHDVMSFKVIWKRMKKISVFFPQNLLFGEALVAQISNQHAPIDSAWSILVRKNTISARDHSKITQTNCEPRPQKTF